MDDVVIARTLCENSIKGFDELLYYVPNLQFIKTSQSVFTDKTQCRRNYIFSPGDDVTP